MSEAIKTGAGLPDVNTIGFGAPFEWLAGAWSDFRRAPVPCMVYGIVMALVSAVLTYGIFYSGHAKWIMVLIGGFLFVGPMLAMGLYEAGRSLEAGQKPTLGQMLFVKTASTRELAYLGLALLILYFFWTRIAQLVYALNTFTIHKNTTEFFQFMLFDPAGHTMAMVGTVMGGAVAFLAYTLVVISAPMLLDRKSDVFRSAVTSFRSVTKNFGPMLLWAALIAVLTVGSILTAFVGMIVVFPLVGLASWRAYRALVQGSSTDVT